MQFIPVLVFGFAAAIGLTPLSREIAMRLGVVDKPNHRKIHTDHKPLMGGLAIYLSFALALILFSPPRHFVQLGAVLAGGTLLAFIGLLDDRYDLRVSIRLVAMVVAALGIVAAGIHFSVFGIPALDYLVTVIWLVALTNALNFEDNMDGLCAGISAIAAMTFLIIALIQGLSLVSILAAAIVGSAVGFLIYNFNPASSFMGDMGALMLGFVLGVLAIKVEMVGDAVSPYWFVPILVLAIPILDINLTVFTRIIEKRPWWQAGKEQISHRLLHLGLSQRQVLLVIYSSAAFFGAVAIGLSVSPLQAAWIVVAACVLLLLMIFGFMVYIRKA